MRNRIIEQPKYINAAALKDALLEAGAINPNGIGIIDRFPAADVAEVKYGKWYEIPNMYISVASQDGSFSGNVTSCSVCREVNPNAYKTNYCPICGANMDGERENNETD